jgi:RimJ/RimL family protein N-acetyltransferase
VNIDPMNQFEELHAGRLMLVPIAASQAQAFLSKDFSGVSPAQGWPHEDTLDGLRMAVEHGYPAGWMVTLDRSVIGDCGIHGVADSAGIIEIGYGLAAPFRGHGYGTEVVAAMTAWLIEQSGVTAISAATLAGNAASRRVLEKNGFEFVGIDEDQQAGYRLNR